MNRLLKGLLAVGAALALSTTAIAPAAAGAPAPNRGQYAALGDSFAAGVGNPPLKGAGTSLRSANAYPVLLAGKVNKVTFLAESGATTVSALAQVADVPEDARQVTLTIGGNDFGFATLAVACAGGLQTETCAGALALTQASRDALPQNLVALLVALRARAPRAVLYVTGYPQLFQSPDGSCPALTALGLSFDPGALLYADVLAVGLDTTIAGTVVQYGLATGDDKLVFVDVTDDFSGKGLCTDDSYLFAPSFLAPGVPNPASLHPNTKGQQAYADAIEDAGFRTGR